MRVNGPSQLHNINYLLTGNKKVVFYSSKLSRDILLFETKSSLILNEISVAEN